MEIQKNGNDMETLERWKHIPENIPKNINDKKWVNRTQKAHCSKFSRFNLVKWRNK